MAATDGIRLIDIATEENPALDQPENPDSVLVSDAEDDGNKVIKAGYFMNVERSIAERFDPAKTGGYKRYEFAIYKGRLVMILADHASGDITVGTNAIEADVAKLFGAVMPGQIGITDSDVNNGVLSLTKNNSLNQLTTDLSTLIIELVCSPDSVVENIVTNFAIQITNSAALTLYVRIRVVGGAPGGGDLMSYLSVADAAGNELDACASGEVNQVTAVGGCWTWAKFVSAQPSS